ncbi:asparagine synthase [Sphingomonas koreensis]|jgi:asparagine synthase (glutamine-hydrolysing)|uniref:asparagine synthase (glutamine-hydrolyzing) n=1 Tax=Sphingomonas koreensis TaxID=93064 RepID=A0A1L6JB89_9SPHN|nr:asparagine synthase C-terminal domain-containing protein [Sphingomonas koreensis]APR53163.1 hypothetical protein BRX40_12675 [Sphingomonas koreensis]RSU24711.1 asparagine synthase [Sphingomonas koreensis]RSU24983.1 asparagine synthase [Sphingomonas koreensis]RSU27019.1 asparagine synthase [Sphingomonas koreensis]RSU32854.1 asparagine synthase [Sphingomonas koreensis]
MIEPRYLAVLDPRHSGAAEALAGGRPGAIPLEPFHRSARMTVLTAPGTPALIGEDGGILIGRLFRKSRSGAIDTLAPSIAATRGQALIDDYWGDYVCLLEPPGGSGLVAIRAPSGMLQAFRIRRGPVTYLVSHIEIALDYGLIAPVIDWQFVAHHLAFLHLRTARTGLARVDEILPGEALETGGAASTRRGLWSPWRFAAPERRIVAADKAAQIVSDAVRAAVENLVSPMERVLLELSGGLDSSLLAAALSQAGRTVVALNLSTPDPGADERDYARAIAGHCGIALHEARISDDIDLTMQVSSLLARPGLPAMLHSADRRFEALAREQEAAAFVSGTGGDCVFCSLGSATPATDHFRAHGPRPALVGILHDLATLHRTNIWTVTRLMMRQIRRGKPALRWRRNTAFLAHDRLPAVPDDHPWLEEPDHVLPGTRAHVRAIMAAGAHLDGYGRQETAPSLYPLLAQPVVEACLRIPTWLWVQGGYDRAVARAAFRQSLPETIATRRTKGAMDAFCARVFDANRDRLKPFLLDGMLADAGLLDRTGIETYLARPFGNRDAHFYELLPIVDTEAWARGVAASA